MGATKTEDYTEKTLRVAALFQALAHPARIAIIEQLAKSDTCQCGELVSELPLAQSTVSQHLKELKNIGIIQGSIEGKSVCYCIEEKVWKEFQEEFNAFFNQDVNVKQFC